jgi:hypothetical protein
MRSEQTAPRVPVAPAPPPTILFVTDADAEPVDTGALDAAVAALLLDLADGAEGTNGQQEKAK